MYNTSLPNVWSPALNPHPNPIITHFNYRIIPVGYCIIIVANIINIQLIDTCITCFALRCHFTPEETNTWTETATVHSVDVFEKWGNRRYH